jgi:hypothetical protein
MPVVVEIGKGDPPGDEAGVDKRTQQDVIGFDESSGTGFLDSNGDFRQRDQLGGADPRVPVERVQVSLRPGDDVTLEIWCIPDPDRLANWFDVVESGALLLADGDDATAENRYVCLQKLSEQMGCPAPPAGGQPGNDEANACGAGGLKLPDRTVVAQLAGQLHQALSKAPIPEVASVQHIQAVYATSRPRIAPAFMPQDFDASLRLTYVRRNETDPVSAQSFVADPANASLARWRPGHASEDRWSGLDQDGATDVMFAGTIRADLDTGDGIRLIGSFASPDHDRLDDERRGFAPDQLERYERGELDLTKNDRIFGFTVAADGRVKFPTTRVPLMTMRDLARTTKRPEHRVLEGIDLLADLKPAADGAANEGPGPSVWRYTFKDNLARRVSLSLESDGRFGPYFQTESGSADNLLSTRSSLDRLAKDRAAAQTTLWIDATRRPARIEPKSLLPAFVWSTSAMAVQRETVVRIRFKRPWFSSGEEERLGIVIWPPELFSISPGDIARRYPTAIPDADLGTGGAYVTMWGSDPIRKGATPDGWLVPREVFAGYGTQGVQLVENVLMPLPAPDTSGGPEITTVSLLGEAARTMNVSLLTYEPRFDPVQSLWNVDVALSALDLPEPFIRLGLVRYQQHAPRHLQVSEPVVEWVQLLPERTVIARYGSQRPGEVGVPVEIEVRGNGSLRSAVEASPSTDADRRDQAKRDRPIMRAELSERRQIGKGPHYQERTVVDRDGRPVAAVDDNAQRSGGGLTWKLRLLVPTNEDLSKAKPGQSGYRVYVEEVIRMKPAGVQPGMPEEDVATGPRFAAHIDL